MIKQFYLTHKSDLNSTTPCQNGTESNGNKKGIPHSPNAKTGALPSDTV